MVLYSHSNSIELTKKIASQLNLTCNLVSKSTFADGEINVELTQSVRNQEVVIVSQIEMPYDNLMELLMICDAARRSGAKDLILVIPYLPHSRQERRGQHRSPITARIIADLLQQTGAKHIISMDLHLGAIEGFYSIPFDKLSPESIFIDQIKKENLDNLCLVSPDFGFMKKMEVYQQALNCDMYVFNKKRLVANKVQSMELIGGDVAGKNVIMIDDIIDTASTITKAANILIELGAKSVRVFSTHAVLANASSIAINRLIDSKIERIYLTNTIHRKLHNSKFVEIDVSSLFSTAIQKIKTY